ncbi:MAG TPA: hypothetical protein VGW34_08605 [Allosphingosinicella sp.]|nr:hypothetical protein [Allosphingosinicella sp.]
MRQPPLRASPGFAMIVLEFLTRMRDRFRVSRHIKDGLRPTPV